MNQHISPADIQFNKLKQFRQAAYQQLGAARDAQFELLDAVILTPRANSFVELSLSPVFRRQWPSVYEAIEDGHPDRAGLLELYSRYLSGESRPILGGDHTAWPRLAAWRLAERTIEHQPTKVPGNKPITVGYGFSTLAWLPEAGSSWALPLLHERIGPEQSPISQAISQLRRACLLLADRPISLWDAEYGCAPFVNGSADIPADKLMRLRPNLCLWGKPAPYQGQGRPALHGRKFKLTDPTTWGQPAETLTVQDPELGVVKVLLWRELHLRKAATHPLVVLRLERPQARATRRDPKAFWLAWLGDPPPALADWWRLYLRRFALDHWYRFAKQRQYWTLPCFGTPEQADRWSDLMPLIPWQLWLARPIVADRPLPWQKPQAQLSPGRVCQGMAGILAVIGTPAQPPKPRGKSAGWPKGRVRQRKARQAVVKKEPKRSKKAT